MKIHIQNDKIEKAEKYTTKDNKTMKILKRIIYTLLGLLLAGTATLVGIILYAEYTGKHFTPDSMPALAQSFSDDESRLAYDENGNIMELPQTQPAADTGAVDSSDASKDDTAGSQAASGTTSAETPSAAGSAPNSDAAANSGATADIATDSGLTASETFNPGTATDTAGSGSDVAAWNPAAKSSYSPSDTGGEPEIAYVMDLGSALFHTPDCAYAANIAQDKRSEMTTTSTKIMNAGYNACPHCHPDQVAAAAAKAATASPAAETPNE